jgi:hypothetical protein
VEGYGDTGELKEVYNIGDDQASILCVCLPKTTSSGLAKCTINVPSQKMTLKGSSKVKRLVFFAFELLGTKRVEMERYISDRHIGIKSVDQQNGLPV